MKKKSFGKAFSRQNIRKIFRLAYCNEDFYEISQYCKPNKFYRHRCHYYLFKFNSFTREVEDKTMYALKVHLPYGFTSTLFGAYITIGYAVDGDTRSSMHQKEFNINYVANFHSTDAFYSMLSKTDSLRSSICNATIIESESSLILPNYYKPSFIWLR